LTALGGGSAYYQALFAERGIKPDVDDPFAALSRLPLLDKAAIRANREVMRPRGSGGGYRTMATGGSTGEPLVFAVDRAREAFDKAGRMRAHRWFGVEPGEKEVYVWGAPIGNVRQAWGRGLRDFVLNDRLLSAFDLSPATARSYVRRMERFDPACVFGYPSSIAQLGAMARAEGLRPRLGNLKVVFVTGEVLDAEQRRAIESFFGVPVTDGYGGRDSGFCAHECPARRMHVTAEHVIVEVVDSRGEPAAVGEVGEIVVTNLDNLATPFVRYRTGDLGATSDERCPCGRALPVIGRIQGRRTDHLVAADGSLRHALSAIYVLRGLGGILQFQIHQRRDRSVDLRIAPDGELNETTRRRAAAGIRECLGDAVEVRWHVVERIEASESGKFRHVVSDAVEGAVGEVRESELIAGPG